MHPCLPTERNIEPRPEVALQRPGDDVVVHGLPAPDLVLLGSRVGPLAPLPIQFLHARRGNAVGETTTVIPCHSLVLLDQVCAKLQQIEELLVGGFHVEGDDGADLAFLPDEQGRRRPTGIDLFLLAVLLSLLLLFRIPLRWSSGLLLQLGIAVRRCLLLGTIAEVDTTLRARRRLRRLRGGACEAAAAPPPAAGLEP